MTPEFTDDQSAALAALCRGAMRSAMQMRVFFGTPDDRAAVQRVAHDVPATPIPLDARDDAEAPAPSAAEPWVAPKEMVREAAAEADEIEVTDEMMAAGMDEWCASDLRYQREEDLVYFIYLAMERAKRASPAKTSKAENSTL